MREKVRSILFMGLLLSISIANILTPVKVFSGKENRYLQGFPEINFDEIIKGEFGKNFEKYTTDQFIGRDKWISLKTIGDLSLLKKDNNRVYFGKDNYLFDVDKKFDEEKFKKKMESITKLLKYNKDIKFTAMLIPSKAAVLKDKFPSFAPLTDEKALVDMIKSSLGNNIDIFDLTSILSENSHEYIYYKTDHHWTTKGAFYAYEYYLKSIGEIPFKEDDFYIEKVSDDFLGSSYRQANFYMGSPDEIYSYKLKEKIDYDITVNNKDKNNSLYNEEFLNKNDKYSYFLGGDKALIEIETSVRNGKSLLIIKDSFANSIVPFLVNHYEKLIIIDPRYFSMDITEFIKEKGVDEVLFLYNIQNFAK